MSSLYFMNYAVFAVFFTLMTVEAGMAVLAVTSYEGARDKIRSYIMPLWEIIGTFAVFYFVEFEATYPSLLTLVGTAYILPILLAALFFILRNAFISYSEYIGKGRPENRYAKIYGISTLVVLFLVLSILTSGVSGIGVDVQQMSVNPLALSFNLFNITMFVAVILIGWFAAVAVTGSARYRKPGVYAGIAGIALVFVSMFSGAPHLAANLQDNVMPVAVSIALFAAAIVLHLKGSSFARYVVFAWLFSGILAYGALQYPYMFGGVLDTNAYAASGAGAAYLIIATAIGGIFLVAALAYLIYVNQRKAGNGAKTY
ncbi:MAG: cytochrome d ubiquinol oxidase subunit II [Candidatus Micrarchaeota archaeon]|nr:cytochrome d ubiquinol oxidase subunit II [Candidatus Micrarchaeota archaeon]